MAKSKNIPLHYQYSLLDIQFQQMAELKTENELENKKLEEVLYDRRSHRKPRHSSQDSKPGSNSRGTKTVVGQRRSLLDFGQVGTQHTGETESPRKAQQHSFTGSPVGTVDNRGESTGVGGILRHGTSGHEQVGDIPDFGSADGTGIEVETVIEPQNYKITDDDKLGQGGAKAKYQDNINAIKLLHSLRSQGAQYATQDEQKILAKYVGFGGLAQAFDSGNAAWSKEYAELKELLSEDEYKNARRSTQDAHFTSETVIKGMYAGLERLGISHSAAPLKILEPSAGIGNFLGLKPENVDADFYTVELDTLTADMLPYLYPKDKHIKNGFHETPFQKPIFDVTLGNPPFGNQKLFDRNFQHLSNHSIHNYFLSKSVDLLQEGGVSAFVVSRYFMDAQSSKTREYLDENAHFLGAVRLPNSAFQENALTSVTTDIVFFQKKTALEKEQGISKGKSWLNTAETQAYDTQSETFKDISINQYFVENPKQILGDLQLIRGQFQGEINCIAPKEMDLSKAIAQGIEVLPQKVFRKDQAHNFEHIQQTTIEKKLIESEYYKNLKQDSFIVIPGQNKIGIKDKDNLLQDVITSIELKGATAFHRMRGMIEVRDALRTLINLEKTDADTESLNKYRKQLNIKYDHFVKKYGFLNSQTNRSLFKDDPEASFLQSLETKFDKGISKEQAQKTGKPFTPPSATKAAIFFQRVLEYAEPPKNAESPLDALSISLRETGKVDFRRMAELLSQSPEDIQAELQKGNFIFQNPINAQWEVKDRYLSGNVKEKLAIAQSFAQNNPEFQHNVEALSAVIPKDIEAVDIGVRFGSSWLPPEVIADFIDEKIGFVSNHNRQLDFIPVLGKWDVKLKIYDDTINKETWGSSDYPADELIKAILTNRSIKVEKEVGRNHENKPIMAIDQEATDVALQKAENIQNAFKDWIWEDDARREHLTRIYNDKFNTHVVPSYDGSHIELVGASAGVTLRAHQKDVVWRSIQEGTALFDHVVGAGKTLATVATIQESKRMGLIKKAMFVVPNHLVYQARDEYFKLYPDANILVAEKTDFLKGNRERFFSKVATGNWDAVIVAHSSFKKIDMPQHAQEEIMQEQIDAFEDAIAGSDNTLTVKAIGKAEGTHTRAFQKAFGAKQYQRPFRGFFRPWCGCALRG